MVLKITQEQYDRLQAQKVLSEKCRNAQHILRQNKAIEKTLRGGVA